MFVQAVTSQNGRAAHQPSAPPEQTSAASHEAPLPIASNAAVASPPADSGAVQSNSAPAAEAAQQAAAPSAQTQYAQQLSDFAALVGDQNAARLRAFLDEVLVYESSSSQEPNGPRKLPEVQAPPSQDPSSTGLVS